MRMYFHISNDFMIVYPWITTSRNFHQVDYSIHITILRILQLIPNPKACMANPYCTILLHTRIQQSVALKDFT